MKTIPLSRGKVALVDDEDFESLNQFKWWLIKDKNNWYVGRNVKVGNRWTTVKMHRQVLPPPSGKEIDHKDRNGLNNQKHNLRIVTRSQNRLNGAHQGNCTGFKGVCFDGRAKRKPFWARLRILGKVFQSGYFQTAQEAAQAYNELALKHCGEYARFNAL
jgi:hypothetical protein